jgi:general secretion pathway protein K
VASSAPVAPTPLAGATPNPPPNPPAGALAPVPSNGTEPIALTRVEDLLAIPGYTPEIIEKLRDFVIVLPERTKVNVNTAPAEVLAALLGVSRSEGSSLVSRRETADYRHDYDFVQQARTQVPPDPSLFALKSEYFLVNSRIRLDRASAGQPQDRAGSGDHHHLGPPILRNESEKA